MEVDSFVSFLQDQSVYHFDQNQPCYLIPSFFSDVGCQSVDGVRKENLQTLNKGCI